ncbi:hypothetical protein, partial [Ruminococcus champanellensis]|uniref:hypothetical protein n=1 Tax=Ruminococcus champanellensis TaxID=1161942 RepID=UPI00266D6290
MENLKKTKFQLSVTKKSRSCNNYGTAGLIPGAIQNFRSPLRPGNDMLGNLQRENSICRIRNVCIRLPAWLAAAGRDLWGSEEEFYPAILRCLRAGRP